MRFCLGFCQLPLAKILTKCMALGSLLGGKVTALQNCCNILCTMGCSKMSLPTKGWTVSKVGKHDLQVFRTQNHLVQSPCKIISDRTDCQDYVQVTFEYLQDWRLYNLLGQPVLVLSHPHGKKVFPDTQREPSVVLPIAFCPATVHQWFFLLCSLILSICRH